MMPFVSKIAISGASVIIAANISLLFFIFGYLAHLVRGLMVKMRDSERAATNLGEEHLCGASIVLAKA
jgi:hypothetical protein